MRIAYKEISSAVTAALAQRGLNPRVQLQAIEPPRPWGVTCNACFMLGAQHAAADIEAATAGLDKKAAKETASQLAREAGLRLAAEVAAELDSVRQAGVLTQYVASVEAEGAYLNFYYDAPALAGLVVAVAGLRDYTPSDPNDNYGSGTVPLEARKQIMVEYAQPNTHKDFHVGHLRNASIGQAIANLLEFAGHTVYKATYLGDVGAHVAKAMHGSKGLQRTEGDALAYWHKAYRAGQEAAQAELVGWLDRWETGDAAARAEWQSSRDECIAAFRSIFAELNVEFHPDCWFYESVVDDTHLGQKTAAELKQRGIAVVDESEEYKGSLYVDFAEQADAVRGIDPSRGGRQTAFSDEISGNGELPTDAGKGGLATASTGQIAEDAGTGARATRAAEPVFTDAEKKRVRQLGKMTILRSNGTSLYQTKELGLAKHKFDWVRQQTGRDLDESLYVVGAEQKLYFEQVFAILRLWGFPNADKCKHIAYELVVLPEGKMSSREGTVVSYRELRDAAIEQATEIIKEKGLITDPAQIESTAKAVAIAAIKYTMLQVGGNQQIVFDFAQALSFDGRSAPYLQYAYARAGKLVAGPSVPAGEAGNAGEMPAPAAGKLHDSEIALVRLLSQFPETSQIAAERYEPAILCNYLYACADAFNAFYRDCRVLDAPEPEQTFRRGLTRAFRTVTRTGFAILALPLPETM